jgi:hypothetical protein
VLVLRPVAASIPPILIYLEGVVSKVNNLALMKFDIDLIIF